ncbi:MAG: methyltransferase domain-containing protein [Proteobacteria bacterium]|nr:methyltransferase domain-containing protein [Pseudomonadota bacterium]
MLLSLLLSACGGASPPPPAASAVDPYSADSHSTDSHPTRAAAAGTAAAEHGGAAAKTQDAAGQPLGIPNERRLPNGLITGGQPDAQALARAHAAGRNTVISLRQPSEPGFEQERAQAQALGMLFVSIPVKGADGLTEANAQAFDRSLSDAGPEHALVHCGSGNRAGALLALRAFHLQQSKRGQALAFGKEAGLTALAPAVEAYFDKACANEPGSARCEPQQQAAGQAAHHDATAKVPAGINKRFLDPKLDVQKYRERWESEEREVALHRGEVVAALNLKKGARIADVGAGTGLYMAALSKAVGRRGKVYALDISPRLIRGLRKRAKKERLRNVWVIQSKQDSTKLPKASVDHVFLCDVYHHLEHHQDMLRSIRKALRPKGELVIVDFDRIPGKSSEWVLEHIRAGKAQFRKEIEQAGFRFKEEVTIPGLEQNYFLRFERP